MIQVSLPVLFWFHAHRTIYRPLSGRGITGSLVFWRWSFVVCRICLTDFRLLGHGWNWPHPAAWFLLTIVLIKCCMRQTDWSRLLSGTWTIVIDGMLIFMKICQKLRWCRRLEIILYNKSLICWVSGCPVTGWLFNQSYMLMIC